MLLASSLTFKERIFIVKRYYQCGDDVQKVQSEFPNEFQRYESPTDDTILQLVEYFEENGTVFLREFKEDENKEDNQILVSV